MSTTTSGTTITTTGRIDASDLTDIANHYRQWFSVNFSAPAPGSRIYASDWNNLRTAILDGAGSAYSLNNFPGTFTSVDRIVSTSWGNATANFSTTTITYTENGSYTIPVGCNSMTINQLIGGGGGGGDASAHGVNSQVSATSGGGGSGGAVYNITSTVTSGEVITIVIGTGGAAQTDGTSSYVQINNTTLSTAGGGGTGSDARATSSTVTGTGGTTSTGGNTGNVPAGGASPYGGYGAGGNGANVTSYYVDVTPPHYTIATATGTTGGSGYCSITFNP